jgi:hypothetical protein
MPRPDEEWSSGRFALFDRLAELTQEPGTSFAELRRLYDENERLRAPEKVFNALLNRSETV